MRCRFLKELEQYLEDIKFPNPKFEDKFWYASMLYWGAETIRDDIVRHSEENIKNIIERWIERFDNWSCYDCRTSRMFSIAYDAAIDVYNLYISLLIKEERKQ